MLDSDKEKIILGIDPGTQVCGFGIIKIINKKANLICIDELILKKYSSHEIKLKKIFDKTISLIDSYFPDEIAIEEPFFGKNVQSMLKLGRAQGVAMAAGLSREIPISEYTPKKVKMAVTGNGNSSKEQVAQMLKTLLNLKDFNTKYLDASDGLAVAMCHFYNSSSLLGFKSKAKDWSSFIKQNPNKVL